MKDTLHIINTILLAFFAVGGGYWLSSALKKNAAVQKNEHLKTVMNFASQAVLWAQTKAIPGAEQADVAVTTLKSRLGSNKLLNSFTDDQLKEIVRHAYATNKADGSLDTIAKEDE